MAGEEIPQQRAESGLSTQQQAILDFEREWWAYAGARDRAVAARFGLDKADYDAALDEVLNHPRAVDYDRSTVLRLVRHRRSLNLSAAQKLHTQSEMA